MPKTRQQKERDVTEYIDKIKRSKAIVFANFAGLKVKEIEELRKLCRKESIDYIVTKKSLMTIAFKQAGISSVEPKSLENSVATVFGYDDEVAPARVIGDYAKTHEALKPIGGVLEQVFVDGAKVIELSKLPSKQELLGKLLGSLQSPISGLVNVMAGNLRGLVQVLNAIKESKV